MEQLCCVPAVSIRCTHCRVFIWTITSVLFILKYLLVYFWEMYKCSPRDQQFWWHNPQLHRLSSTVCCESDILIYKVKYWFIPYIVPLHWPWSKVCFQHCLLLFVRRNYWFSFILKTFHPYTSTELFCLLNIMCNHRCQKYSCIWCCNHWCLCFIWTWVFLNGSRYFPTLLSVWE